MRICIPIMENDGLKSEVNAHFGSAPYFLIYDNEKGVFEVINNSDSQHMHGMCHPLKALDNKGIDAVVCGGMGARAVQKLNEGGIKAYRANAGMVEEIIKRYNEGILEEITMDNACINHNCH